MIYPNPSRGQVTLRASDRAPEDFVIDVVSLTGARVMSLARTDHPDFSSLPSGTYMISHKNTGRQASLPDTLYKN